MKKVFLIILIIGFLSGAYFLTKREGDSVQKEVKSEEQPKEEKQEDKNDEVRVINISAKKFEFSPNVINVKKGEKIRIVVEDSDVKHGIMVPDLLFPPSQKNFNEIDLKIDKEGEYVFYCANELCGGKHGLMKGKIIVS